MKRSLAAWAVGIVPMSSIATASGAEPPPPAAAPRAPAEPVADEAPLDANASADVAVEPPPPLSRRARINAEYKRLPWIRRWAPQRNLGEIGISAGVFLPSEEHDLYDPVTRPSEPFWTAGVDVAVRGGFYPLRSLGVEAEFNAMPTRMRNLTNDFAFVYGFQSHVVFQLPYYSVVPFFLAGGGLLGIRSNILIQGNDVDPALHYGAGVKIAVSRIIGLRVEARQILSASEAQQGAGTGHVQVLGGITFTLGRKPPPPPPKQPPPVDPDRDRDGILNEVDECPDVLGIAPHGCPDTDGDSFRDSVDACPEVPGVAPDGCPVKDTDGDGILDPDDDCIFEPETVNNYKDRDGCPDELPPEVKKFSGTIDGIEFDTGKDTIRAGSRPLLDRAVGVLEEFPDIRLHIVGHTDDVGAPEFNLDLSRRRAASVRQYLVDKGIDPSRVTTEGRGMNDPRVPNDSDANRAKNRRIDFEVRSEDSPAPGATPTPATPAPSPAPAGDGGSAPAQPPAKPATPTNRGEPSGD